MPSDGEQPGKERSIELSESQRERFEEIKDECSDDELPEPTDEQILKSLMNTWAAVDEGHYSGHIEREDTRVRKREGQPALEVGDAEIILKTHFEGAPPQSVDIDHVDQYPFFILDFDEEYFGGLLEITPEFVSADEAGDSDE